MQHMSVVVCSIWKQMSLNTSMSAADRAKLAVWDYPYVVAPFERSHLTASL